MLAEVRAAGKERECEVGNLPVEGGRGGGGELTGDRKGKAFQAEGAQGSQRLRAGGAGRGGEEKGSKAVATLKRFHSSAPSTQSAGPPAADTAVNEAEPQSLPSRSSRGHRF